MFILLLGIFNFSNFFFIILNLFRSNFVTFFILLYFDLTYDEHYDYQRRCVFYFIVIRAAWNKMGLQIIIDSI